MTENLISWNIVNWVTVVLMCFFGFIVIGTIAQLGKKIAGQ
jgi:hypothetical protein